MLFIYPSSYHFQWQTVWYGSPSSIRISSISRPSNDPIVNQNAGADKRRYYRSRQYGARRRRPKKIYGTNWNYTGRCRSMRTRHRVTSVRPGNARAMSNNGRDLGIELWSIYSNRPTNILNNRPTSTSHVSAMKSIFGLFWSRVYVSFERRRCLQAGNYTALLPIDLTWRSVIQLIIALSLYGKPTNYKFAQLWSSVLLYGPTVRLKKLKYRKLEWLDLIQT